MAISESLSRAISKCVNLAFPVLDQARQSWEDPGVGGVILPDGEAGSESDGREMRFVDKVEEGERMVPPVR